MSQVKSEFEEISCPSVMEIKFGHEGNSHKFTGEGWGNPERSFTWTVGPRSEIHIGKLDLNYDHSVIMDIHPFIPPKRAFQRLKLYLNDIRIASIEVGKPGEIRIWVPAEDTRHLCGQDISISFCLPDAARPADFVPSSSDDRPLALAFRELKINQVRGDTSLDKKMLMEVAQRIESLGANCELGLIQRLVGVEPLSLFRFSTSRLKSLIPALANRFDGLGAPENIMMDIHGEGDNAQWMVIDKLYGFVFHADAHPDRVSEAEIRKREARRLPWLAQKLLRDLASAEKIFVYQGDEMTSLDKARELLAALRSFGPNLLLVVLVDTARSGTVEFRGEGLYVGYIDRLEKLASRATISTPSWYNILRGIREVPVPQVTCDLLP